MRNFWLVILVLALVFGMMVVGCEDTSEAYVPQPQPGVSANNPIDRVVENTNLGIMTSPASGWRQLLNSINNQGKYINLDLSACTMTGTSFNPDSTVDIGKKYIVSIILPSVATSIEAGALSGGTYVSSFNHFNNLKSISGVNIVSIGDYSFWRLSNDSDPKNIQSADFPKATTIGKAAFFGHELRSINFPRVTTIGSSAFSMCRFEHVSFPLVQTVGESAFSFCFYLKSISFPASAELGRSGDTYSNPFTYCDSLISFTLTGSGSLSVIENGKALVRNGTILLAYPSASGNITMNNITALDSEVFQGCYDLDSVNFPQVTSIGSEAFASCSNIQYVNFPLVTSIGSSAFSSCSRLQSANFLLVTNIGSQAFVGCPWLQNLDIPKVTTIGSSAFAGNTTNLLITMGSVAPTLGYDIFRSITTAKTVTVKVPSGATGYTPFTGSSITVSGTNTTANWANGFRGGGWNGSTWAQYGGTSYINQNISLTIQ